VRDVLKKFQQFLLANQPLALIRVIETWGSSPRPPGSMMIVTTDMHVEGSVSAGCVENEIAHAAREIIDSGECKLMEFGVSDETAWSVGLSCGGKLKILMEAIRPAQFSDSERLLWNQLFESVRQNQPCLLVTLIENTRTRHLLYNETDRWIGASDFLSDAIAERALRHFREKKSEMSQSEGKFVFYHYFPRQPLLIVIGGTHIAVHLIPLAKQMEFKTIVIDPRAVFARPERFPIPPDEIIPDWPANALPTFSLNDETYTVVLTHDPKVDDEALQILLKNPVRYIGVLGSRKTHARRLERLKEMGFEERDLAQIHGPVGLPLGGKSPQEIALSIMAEIIQIKNNTPQ